MLFYFFFVSINLSPYIFHERGRVRLKFFSAMNFCWVEMRERSECAASFFITIVRAARKVLSHSVSSPFADGGFDFANAALRMPPKLSSSSPGP